jgi:hypothetical protein
MTSILINNYNYDNFLSNKYNSFEEIIIHGDFMAVVINLIFSKINGVDLKKITINGAMLNGQLGLNKFINLEYLELGQNFNIDCSINLEHNKNLKFIKILSLQFNHPINLSYNTQLEVIEFSNLSIFNNQLDLTQNVNLSKLILPSKYNKDLCLIDADLKNRLKKNNETNTFKINVFVHEINDKLWLNPFLKNKRMMNIEKLRNQGRLDEHIKFLTEEEFNLFY